MIEFVLFVIVHTCTANGYCNSSVSMTDFTSENKCEYAATVLKSRAKNNNGVPPDAYCLRK